jgi:hypothetical protein
MKVAEHSRHTASLNIGRDIAHGGVVYLCPHCNKPGISVLRRACLGPGIPATCTACGAKVGVPWGKSAIALLPFVLAILIAPSMPSMAVSVLVWLVGAVAMFVLFFTIVPLIKK